MLEEILETFSFTKEEPKTGEHKDLAWTQSHNTKQQDCVETPSFRMSTPASRQMHIVVADIGTCWPFPFYTTLWQVLISTMGRELLYSQTYSFFSFTLLGIIVDKPRNHIMPSLQRTTQASTAKHCGQPLRWNQSLFLLLTCSLAPSQLLLNFCSVASAFLKIGCRHCHSTSVSSTSTLTLNTNPFQFKKTEDKHEELLNSRTSQSSPKPCFQLSWSQSDSRFLLAWDWSVPKSHPHFSYSLYHD